MLISEMYAPKAAHHPSAEEVIFGGGGAALLDELRTILLRTRLVVNPTKTTKKGKGKEGGKTGNLGLAQKINEALASSLKAHGWGPEAPPGSSRQHAVD